MFSYFRFRYNRWLRRMRRQFRVLNRWAIHYVQRHVYGAWHKLLHMGWWFYFIIVVFVISIVSFFNNWQHLESYYLTDQPKAGGSYSEGLLGEVKVLNPILNDSTAATNINHLIFSGLTKHGSNGVIEPDLAKSWSVSKDNRTYTFYLKDNVVWHDDVPFSANDVAFTINTIQNPDSRSSYSENWRGVKTEVLDEHTISFTLPASYPSFLNITTVGIIPNHILSSISPANLRLAEFSRKPVGTGPFVYDQNNPKLKMISLKRNEHFYDGEPRLENIHLYLYDEPAKLIDAYVKKQIAGFSVTEPSELNKISKQSQIKLTKYNQPAYLALFMNIGSPKLSKLETRTALANGINRDSLINLKTGANGQAHLQNLPVDLDRAGIDYVSRAKYDNPQARSYFDTIPNIEDKKLTLVTADSTYLKALATEVAKQLNEAGLSIELITVDTNTLQQNYIRPRKYDLLLYGQNVGADMDVYNFWHSSQAVDPGLNLSVYKNPTADKALESARLARDPANFKSKLTIFLQTWDNDVPAVILYSPNYVYAHNQMVYGTKDEFLIEPADRFYNVQTWAVRYEKILKAKANR